jgi:hypothetical protein
MNPIRRLFNFMFTKEKIERITTIDPENLHQVDLDKARSKNYDKYKKTYYYEESGGTNLMKEQKRLRLKGKRVKHWRLVTSAFDFSMDEYIPIYHKNYKK